ncbi:hypothetical protein G3I40_05125 [Streptomyces sp. SID14478]|uniref:hypothetical protein n=1 Tax=Streptomyces sp. SID14478 TaxID=2706073 RepID=UPI0013D93806|nr:hypothetical protein [Streptomyces sp. SID14478]NEB74617.1 hypothetical protein [Streptomyces sp. SID14478]
MNASDTTTAPRRPATAWPLENALISAAMAAQRVSWIDAPARALGLKPFTRHSLTRQVLVQLRRTAHGRPTRLRTAFGTFLMPLTTDDATSLIGQAEEAGVRGPVAALTADGHRLRLTEHVALPVSLSILRARVSAAAAEEAAALLSVRQGDDTVSRSDWCAHTQRLARRIVLGDDAADDTLVTDILDATTRAADAAEHADRIAALHRRFDPYLQDPGTGPLTDDPVALQHALEMLTRALDDTAAQALALVTLQPALPAADRAERAVDEALHRYPPLPATVHEVRAPFAWHGLAVEAGTEILYATTWLNDLDDDQEQTGGTPTAGLCAAPAPCCAAALGVLAATELVRALTQHAEPALRAPRLKADALPAELPAHSLALAFTDTEGATVHAATDTPPPLDAAQAAAVRAAAAAGQSPAHYALLITASASRLEEHARQLSDCARQSGWNHDAFGERCRMTLLAHAERCARSAADTRKVAEWLAN